MTHSIKKIIYVLCFSLLFSPGYSSAADVNLTTDTQVVVSGETLSVSGSTALIKFMKVESSSVSFDLEYGNSITLSSSNKRPFSTNASQAKVSTTCGSSSTVTITSASATVQGVIVTIDTSTTCSGSSSTTSTNTGGNGPIGGGGGGGGGGSAAPSIPVSPALAVAPPSVSPAPALSVSAIFVSNLRSGLSGEAVTRLQLLLAQDRTLYPEGLVTSYFGAATRRAVGRFQERYGLSTPGEAVYGTVGPKTRAKLAEIFGGVMPEQQPQGNSKVLGASIGAAFTKSLRQGMTDQQVKTLQQILNRDPETQVTPSGGGSLGYESEFFGQLTLEALKRFQVKYGIANEGDVGYGSVGPRTRAKLNELVR